jgi:hypothetical protein
MLALHPPRAPLVLRVGVTGHRPNKDRELDVDKLRPAAREIFQHIADAMRGFASTHAELFDSAGGAKGAHGGGTLRVISALAAGADQWLADEAIGLGYELQSPLPLPRDEYANDFEGDNEGREHYRQLLAKATAALEFDGKVRVNDDGRREVDSASYEAVGRALLAQSDILVALWDGEPAKGGGGTGWVVAKALTLGIPVIVIDATHPTVWELQGCVMSPASSDDKNPHLSQLKECIFQLLAPPTSNFEDSHEAVGDLRKAYFHEVQPKGNPLLGWWMLFRDLVGGEILKPGKLGDWVKLKPFAAEPIAIVGDAAPAHASISAATATGAESRGIEDFYRPHYAWATGLSVYYATLYRSSFVLNYLLGALAVFCAVFGLTAAYFRETDKDSSWEHIILASGWVEFLIIALVLVITYSGNHRRWHERWVDYRTLAERLRLAQFLAWLGGGGQQVSLPAHLASYGNPAATWMHWHYRAIERAAGLATASFDSNYLGACQKQWATQLIKDQEKYHSANERRFHRLDERLHRLGNAMFIGTLVACGLHLLCHWSDHQEASIWLTAVAASLPAIGGALAAIRAQGEFRRVARRSAAMHRRLGELQLALASAPTRVGELNSVELRKLAEKVVNLMISETLDWRVVFQDRPLGLPA